MNIRELKAVLSGLDEDTEVVLPLDTAGHNYRNLTGIVVRWITPRNSRVGRVHRDIVQEGDAELNEDSKRVVLLMPTK